VSAQSLTVLGIESSCDESAVAIVEQTAAGAVHIRANLVLSQLDQHRPYGGVVPEIAARAHVEHLDGLVRQAMDEARLDYEKLDAVAATAGPGLIGGVIVGLMTGKGIAFSHDKPLIAVNHLEGHALTARLIDPALPFPYLLLLISGGHCQLLIVHHVGHYTRLGTTMDDAIGEAFDKTAKLMGLGYPGGPAVEQAAIQGDPRRFDFPRPLAGRPGCDFSFSGLKTAVRQAYEGLASASAQDLADIAASFQAAVGDVLVDRCSRAFDAYAETAGAGAPRHFVVAGGVAANAALRARLHTLCMEHDYKLMAPPMALCTDNGAMIAWAGIERLRQGLVDDLGAVPRARWPLESLNETARSASS